MNLITDKINTNSLIIAELLDSCNKCYVHLSKITEYSIYKKLKKTISYYETNIQKLYSKNIYYSNNLFEDSNILKNNLDILSLEINNLKDIVRIENHIKELAKIDLKNNY